MKTISDDTSVAPSLIDRDEVWRLFVDHYWDSFQKDRDLILCHVDAVLRMAADAGAVRASSMPSERKPHCPHCGRGDNSGMPKIKIDWDGINRDAFENSRASLRKKLSDVMERKEGAYYSDNWFTRDQMYVLDELLKAAEAQRGGEPTPQLRDPKETLSAFTVLKEAFFEPPGSSEPTYTLPSCDCLDGARPLPFDRDALGRLVREAWVRWAQAQPNPKPTWLAPYDELAEPDKEADRQIGEAVARWAMIGDAASRSLTSGIPRGEKATS